MAHGTRGKHGKPNRPDRILFRVFRVFRGHLSAGRKIDSMSIALPPFTPGQRHVLTLPGGVPLAVRYIPPTEARGFRMGSRGNKPREEPVHRVRIAQGFWLGETPVTQAQFAAWTQTEGVEHRNAFPNQPNHPAENMRWREAVQFCAWLTKRLTVTNEFPVGAGLTCLPTDAEWEYACRAGSDTEYHTGDGAAALVEAGGRLDEDYDADTRVVGLGRANAWGLHDLHGHVWQWCHDEWGEGWDKPRPVYRRAIDGDSDQGAEERARDYATPASYAALLKNSRQRVLSGGAWDHAPSWSRSAFRRWWRPGECIGDQGFRLCLAPGPAAFAKAPASQGGEERSVEAESDAPGAAGAGAARDWSEGLTPPAQPARPAEKCGAGFTKRREPLSSPVCAKAPT